MSDLSDKSHGKAMRADSALSLLRDNELCIVTMKDGSEREVRWDKVHGCFYLLHPADPAVCSFDEIEEWRPAAIKF